MSYVGYAVFGTPSGLRCESNGLFSELDLNSLLFLDNTHIILNPGERVVMFRRFATDLNNRKKLDGLIVALYQFALPVNDNRDGSFFGSAICFKSYQPNQSSFIRILFELFNGMKNNLNEEHRFKSLGKDSWGVSLPDYSKNVGLQNLKLTYEPFVDQVEHGVVKISSIQNEVGLALNHFMLNRSYHHYRFLYLSSNASVLNKFKSNSSFNILSLGNLFNYENSFKYLRSELTSAQEKLDQHKSQIQKLNGQKSSLGQSISQLEQQVKSTQGNLLRLEEDIRRKNSERESIDKENRILRQERNSSSSSIANRNNRDSELLNRAIHVIRAYEGKGVYNTHERNPEELIDELFNQKEKIERKRQSDKKSLRIFKKLQIAIVVFIAILLTVLFMWGALWAGKKVWRMFTESSNLTQVDEGETVATYNSEEKSTIDFEELKNKISALKPEDGSYDNQEQDQIKQVFSMMMDGRIPQDEQLYIEMLTRKWQFWELIYEDVNLIDTLEKLYKKVGKENQEFVEDIDLARQNNSFYINIPDEDFKSYDSEKHFPCGNQLIEDVFEKYVKENNDIFEKVKNYSIDHKIKKEYFKWLVRVNNTDLNTDDSEFRYDKIKIPFLK